MGNVLHSLGPLSIWSPVGSGGLGGAALLVEECHLMSAFEMKKPRSLPVCSLCFALAVQHANFQLPALVLMVAVCVHARPAIMDSLSGAVSQNKPFLL